MNFIEQFAGEDRLVRISAGEDASTWTVRFRLYDSAGTLLATKTSGSGVEPDDDDETYLVVSLNDGTSKNLSVGSYKYDVWVTDAGEEEVIDHGHYVVRPVP